MITFLLAFMLALASGYIASAAVDERSHVLAGVACLLAYAAGYVAGVF